MDDGSGQGVITAEQCYSLAASCPASPPKAPPHHNMPQNAHAPRGATTTRENRIDRATG